MLEIKCFHKYKGGEGGNQGEVIQQPEGQSNFATKKFFKKSGLMTIAYDACVVTGQSNHLRSNGFDPAL